MFLSWINKLLLGNNMTANMRAMVSASVDVDYQGFAVLELAAIIFWPQDDQRRSDHGGLIRVFSIHSAIHITIR